MNTTNHEHEDLQLTTGTAENATESKPLSGDEVKRIHPFETPLEIVECHDGWFIALGKARLSPLFATEQQAKDFTSTWPFVINLIILINGQCKDIERMAEQAAKKRNKQRK